MKQHKLSNEELSVLCLALDNLFHAGIAPGDALDLMAQDEAGTALAPLLEQMARRADEGIPLDRIFRETGRFPSYLCDLLEVGRRVGKTEQTLEALARHYEARRRMDERLYAALLYPSILLAVMLAVVAVLLVWVLPVFNDVYARLGSTLTGLAGGLVMLGDVLRKGMPVLCAMLAVAVGLLAIAAVWPRFREGALTAWRAARGNRGVLRQINAARFAQALSLGLSSGLTEQETVQLALSLSPESAAFRVRCERCLARVEQGESLAAALSQSGLMSKARCRLLEAGSRSGRSELVMEQMAGQMLEESERALEARVSGIEPALMLVTSVLVGAILLSVMLPLMHIMSGIG